MKEFFNWLGVNEKIAKLVLWLFFIMVSLIIVNTFFDSMGMPYYKVTIENLSKIKLNNFLNYMCTVIVSLMNFYSIVFLALEIKKFKKVLPYSIAYLLSIIIVEKIFGYAISQLYIILFIAILLYFLSGKRKCYIFYSVISIVINMMIQYLCYYLFKGQYIDSYSIQGINYILTSLDYFIVMFFIILVKEVYLKYKKEA